MRLGRYFLAGQPIHVIQRGNNRQPIFFTHQDATHFLNWLREAAVQHRLAVHAYVLMPNHIHLLASPQDAESLPRTMQSLGRRYVRHINDRLGRSGSLWEGRYRAAIVDTDTYFFRCSRYIELNPVRANLVAEPDAYQWSSFHANGLGKSDAMVTPHSLFLSLGTDARQRAAAYRDILSEEVPPSELDAIRAATNGGWALGDAAFGAQITERSGRRSQPLPRGRPRAQPMPDISDSRAFLA